MTKYRIKEYRLFNGQTRFFPERKSWKTLFIWCNIGPSDGCYDYDGAEFILNELKNVQ